MTTSACTLPTGWAAQGAFNNAANLCSMCGTKQIFGGYKVFGSNAKVTRTYNNLPPHYKAKISFNFWKIDSWNSETFRLEVNGKQIVTTFKKPYL